MRIEVEVEDGVIPSGKEIVRIGWAQEGEQRATGMGVDVSDCNRDRHSYSPGVIVRDAWQWPDWLLCPFIAMDSDGDWYGFFSEPYATNTEWLHRPSNVGGRLLAVVGEHSTYQFLAFTPPPCTDWKQSLRRNPNDGKAVGE